MHALDGALRKALVPVYPALEKVQLVNFAVRIVNSRAATAARVRVVIESADTVPDEDGNIEHWTTLGVSENIIEASWLALVDSIEYKLLKERVRSRMKAPVAE